MLVINRRKTEKFVVADNIHIEILEVGKDRVKFGITAPREIPIGRRPASPENPEKPVIPPERGAAEPASAGR